MSGETANRETRPSLLLRVRDVGDADAWRSFVTIYAPLVYGYIRRRGFQDADAADLTQDVMGEVARVIRSFEYQPARGRFRDWLLLITRRRISRFAGHQAKRREQVCETAELEQIEDDRSDGGWDDAFNARVLRVALERIRPCFEPVTWLRLRAGLAREPLGGRDFAGIVAAHRARLSGEIARAQAIVGGGRGVDRRFLLAGRH